MDFIRETLIQSEQQKILMISTRSDRHQTDRQRQTDGHVEAGVGAAAGLDMDELGAGQVRTCTGALYIQTAVLFRCSEGAKNRIIIILNSVQIKCFYSNKSTHD